MRTGLVLEGGAMRGMYTTGVVDAFLDHGVKVDSLMGVSAGALFGANLLSGQRSRALRYNKRFMGDPRYMSLRSLLTTGDFVNKEFAFYRVSNELDPYDEAAFEAYGASFTAVVTNVDTGEAEYLDIANVLEQMEVFRATSALPYISRMVEIDGKRYLDGGLTDSIPVRAMMDRGVDKVIVVLTRPRDYRKKPDHAPLANLVYAGYPNLRRALRTRPERYNAQCEEVAQLEREGKVFVIRPDSALDIGRLEKNPARLQAVYERGLADANAAMEALQTYLRG